MLHYVLLALILSIMLPFLQGCGLIARGMHQGVTEVANSEMFHQGHHGELSKQERKWAETAWRYFINNYHSDTGLVNGVDEFSVTSVWNIADTIAATISAHGLGLIDNYEFDHRITPLLESLNSMSLSYDKMPNVFYATGNNGSMVDKNGNSYDNNKTKAEKNGRGDKKKKKSTDDSDRERKDKRAGWSAIDIGRLLVWLRILHSYAPQYAEYIDKAVLRWNFCQTINDCGELSGVNRNSSNNPLSLYPKKPLGYYDYALMGYAAWGFPRQHTQTDLPTKRLYGIDVPYSKEDSRETGICNPLVSLPYILLGLEFNWDQIDDQHSLDSYHSNHEQADLAQRIYKVQEKRYQYKGIFTARTDHQRNSKPYILYDTIFANGYSWNTLTPEGELYPDLALVSTPVVFGMWALWKTSYTDGLMQLINTLYDPERGWFEGRREKDGAYERTISCTTNATVLEAMYYKIHGKLYKGATPRSYADIILEDEFSRPPCSPPERDDCQEKYKK